MDLLSSIMDSMDKPPSLSEEEKDRIKKKKSELEKRRKIQTEKINRFKDRVENKLISHFKDPNNIMLKFEPMEQIFRSIVHEVADAKGLLSYAFGIDGVDRYVRVYRRDNPPSQDEINARKRGEPWNKQIQQELNKKREEEKLVTEETRCNTRIFIPNNDYREKYVHLIGEDSALEAAKKTETNKTYGFVPSENKKDSRSIEQTMADIRAKKKQKITSEAGEK